MKACKRVRITEVKLVRSAISRMELRWGFVEITLRLPIFFAAGRILQLLVVKALALSRIS